MDGSGPNPGATLEEAIAHFGVRGMKWGVRRTKQQLDSSDDAKVAAASIKKVKKGGTKALTNQELQQLVMRMNLERQFENLKAQDAGKLARGQNAAKKVLGLAKTGQEIYSFAKSPLARDLAKALRR